MSTLDDFVFMLFIPIKFEYIYLQSSHEMDL